MAHRAKHCVRPWWKRPLFWFIGIAALLLLGWMAIERIPAANQVAMPYSTFLDQVDAGNIARVTFQGTEITGRFKSPPANSLSAGAERSGSFESHVPDFGDPALIAELRSEHVAIDVAAPSAWSWLLGRVPWPMLIFVGVVLLAGLMRLLRGGKAQTGPAVSTLPAHGMMGLLAGLLSKQAPTVDPPAHDGDESSKR